MVEQTFDRVIASVKAAKFAYVRFRVRQRCKRRATSDHQALAVYSDPEFGDVVSAWGAGTVWVELRHLLVNCRGRILDACCGTGVNLRENHELAHCRLYGCDISPYLIGWAAAYTGVLRSRLTVSDATTLPYRNGAFDYSYSIGSLEHFTEAGIGQFLLEMRRVTRHTSFHQVPTSRSGKDEGWITLDQEYFNNSINWWRQHFRVIYNTVYVLDSVWEDGISKGKWFVCMA